MTEKEQNEWDLLQSVQTYINNTGGKALVVGGIQVQKWPADNRGVYRLAISFTGKPPVGIDQTYIE